MEHLHLAAGKAGRKSQEKADQSSNRHPFFTEQLGQFCGKLFH